MPHPPITRGIDTLEKALRSDPKFEVIDIQPYKQKYVGDLAFSLYFCDGGARYRQLQNYSRDPLLPLSKFLLDHPSAKDHSIHELWKVR